MRYLFLMLLLTGCVTKSSWDDIKEVRIYMTSHLGQWCGYHRHDGKSCSYVYYPSNYASWSAAEGHIYVIPSAVQERIPYEKCRLAGYDSYPCPVDVNKTYHRIVDLDQLYSYPSKTWK